MSRHFRPLTALSLALGLALAPALPAAAEGTIRLVEQPGISYLPFHVIRDQGLLDRHGAAKGIEITSEWAQLSGGAATNDALLSGSVDIVAAGVGPLLTIWDRTRGAQNVRGIVAGAQFPFALVTNNPKVKSIADFGPDDRIAVPSVGVSVQARTLQFAAAKLWGAENFQKLDELTVSLPHPDATQALLSRSGTITAHFSNSPFQQLALADNGIHQVLDSFEVYGGPTTSIIIYTTEAFREKNPLTYAAFVDAYSEAAAWIAENPEAAADTYIRVTGSKLDRDLILSILSDDRFSFDPTPRNTEALAHFLHDVGALKNRPESWRDYFFETIHDRPGS
ncbi:MAG: nitrate ABC transporter substrate-binding protein [Alphaproteobacteria bacterium HGW-Alphaproteobacteria-1]|jgi:NitT/TauT family transport system substrate-binding protein|nr:MAG: nitrate ABC transporter substrate-binding protein [Alphaproteobacteria bacterium HGW-Alphaproteobacteria-1]